MFKYFLTIFVLLVGCTENKIELSQSKDSLKTSYGVLKIDSAQYSKGLFFNGKEIDFDGNDVFEIEKFWKLKDQVLVLVSHANTNRCDQIYKIISLDRSGAKASNSFGNCDTPSNISLEGEALKLKFPRTNWQAAINVEYLNNNLTVSEVKPVDFENFMIGLCEIKSDEDIKECSVNEAKNLDTFTTTFSVFNKTEMVTYVVFGRDYYKSIPPQFRKNDATVSVPVTYVGTAAPNKIWVKINGENGCIFTNEYIKIGNRIDTKPIAMDGNCSKIQTMFFENELKDGSKQIKYIK
jgi:hypothetical protein